MNENQQADMATPIPLDAVGGVFQQLEAAARAIAIQKAAELRTAVTQGNGLVAENERLTRALEDAKAELVLRDAEIERLNDMVAELGDPPENAA